MHRHSKVFKLIATIIAEEYAITLEQMFGMSRKKRYAEARQVFHYICYKNLGLTLMKIGAFSAEMGRPLRHDHATVLHGHNTIKDRIQVDRRFKTFMNGLEKYVMEKHVEEEMKKDEVIKDHMGIATELVTKDVGNLLDKMKHLIREIMKGDTENDVIDLIKIQTEKNHGRLYKTSQGNNVLGKVSGHQHESGVHTSTT